MAVSDRLLLVLVGDSPRLPTGLGRIGRDLTGHLWEASERLGISLLHCAWEYDGTAAALYYPPIPWPLAPFPDVGQDWGAARIERTIRDVQLAWGFDDAHTILFSVWDPARCFEYRALPWAKWGYFAVDGHNRNGSFGGPAAEAVRRYQRVLAYGEYGAGVLKEVLGKPVDYLPHGHFLTPERIDALPAIDVPERGWRFGCVASNTPRKDLGLFFRTLAELRGGETPVYGWLHTDQLVTDAWSIPELLEVYAIAPNWVTLSYGAMSEQELLGRYLGCAATLAVGRGEGFGYPIVESLACGRGVVHVDYAGGVELVPRMDWRVPAEIFDYTNPYALGRPILHESSCAPRLATIAAEALESDALAHYCQASVAHLHWEALWPRWESWVRRGLTEHRERL